MRRIGLAGLVAVASWTFGAGLDDVLVPGATVEKLAGGFGFTEGATVNAAGEVFFVDQPNNKILRWTRERGVRVFMEPSDHANGMCFAPDGSLFVCADEKMELWSVEPDGGKVVIACGYGGTPFNGPNDVWACPRGGGCYVTDPFFQRSWWTHTAPPQGTRQVYYVPRAGAPRRVTEDLVQPNGIVGTTDGRTLYVSDISAKQVWAYVVGADGALTGKRLFCNVQSDGMTIDADGRLYLTGKEGVSVVDPAGRLLGVIKIPEKWTANVCIGGPNKDTLFVTASTGFYAVPLKVKGSAQGK